MISQSNNSQPMGDIMNNTHGNNYVNHAIRAPVPVATVAVCAQVGAESNNDALALGHLFRRLKIMPPDQLASLPQLPTITRALIKWKA